MSLKEYFTLLAPYTSLIAGLCFLLGEPPSNDFSYLANVAALIGASAVAASFCIFMGYLQSRL